MSSFASLFQSQPQKPKLPPVIKETGDVYRGSCYDSLPTINTSSRFIFDVASFSDAEIYSNQYQVYTSPYGNFSTLSKRWYAIQATKYRLENTHPDTVPFSETLDEYSSRILQSIAPYGYEYEKDYYHNSTYSLPSAKQENLQRYKPKFINHKCFCNRVSQNDKTIFDTAFFFRTTYQIESNLLTCTLIKKSFHKFTFWKESKKLIQQKGLRMNLVFKNVYLGTEFRNLLTEYAKKSCPKVYPLLEDQRYFAYYRKVFQNQFWTDIHSQYACDYLHSATPEYARVMYHYKKYGTKKARQVLYQTTNKALIKKYEELTPVLVPAAMRATKLLLESGVTLEKCVWYLSKVIEAHASLSYYTRNNYFLYADDFIKALLIVQTKYPLITFDKVLRLEVRTAYIEIIDIARSVIRLQVIADNDDITFEFPLCTDANSLAQLSTRLSDLYRHYQHKEDFIPFAHVAELEEQYNYEDDQFIYKAARTANELRDCGNVLNICVGSYGSNARDRFCDIIFVRKKESPDEHYGCIEVRSDVLRQVKLKRNSSGKTNPDLNESVLKWAESILVDASHCYDIETNKEKLIAKEATPVAGDFDLDLAELLGG